MQTHEATLSNAPTRCASPVNLPLKDGDSDSLLLKGLDTKLLIDVKEQATFMADAAFPPDKSSLWSGPMEKDGWVHAHNSIRGELDIMMQITAKLADIPLVAWQVEALQGWWASHYIFIHGHHDIEETTLNPWLAKRILLPARLTTDHVELVEMLEGLGTQFKALAPGDTLASIRTAWAAYQEHMLPHLHEEEQIGLPLLRAFFTPGEFGPVIGEILQSAPIEDLGAFWYWMGGTKEAIMEFMKENQIPWFVYHVAFKKQVDWYKENTAARADALLSGVPFAPKSKGCFACFS